ncbi:MAG: NTP transferase domain-containing protein [Candidatus Omnitrophica bacterium]|nr:NTP transferase domain-containing protein [Candidatus Omnitrophota bacterium]
MHKNIVCIILAAGKGERMKSHLPKVLHPVCGRPMLLYVLDLVEALKFPCVVVVLGYGHQKIRPYLKKGLKIVIQRRLLGTADAVKSALGALKNFKGTVLVLYADNPLLKKETIKKLLLYHRQNNLDVTLLTAMLEKPTGYGRVLRDKYANICGIVEENEANDYEKQIKEVNTGVICFEKDKLVKAIKHLRLHRGKKEYYLTDCISVLYKEEALIDAVRLSDKEEALGVNSRQDLSLVNRVMQERINQKLMQEGVTIIDPKTTFIAYGTEIGKDTVIYPFTVIENDVKIGKNCSIGPFAHLREGTRLKDDVIAGNFLEIVRSKISSQTLIKHFGYLGDSRIGRGVNIGAGTVTANFDKGKKNVTTIKDGAFIGCDTVLVAPVKIGKTAVTGAGSVIPKNKDVAAGQVVVGIPARPIKN